MLLVTKGAEGVVVCRGQFTILLECLLIVSIMGREMRSLPGYYRSVSSTGLSTDEREMRRIIDLAQRCGALAVTAKAMTALPCRQDWNSEK